MVGALIIEPEGSTWVEDVNRKDKDLRLRYCENAWRRQLPGVCGHQPEHGGEFGEPDRSLDHGRRQQHRRGDQLSLGAIWSSRPRAGCRSLRRKGFPRHFRTR